MVSEINKTHDASLRSWVASANTDHTDFPIQNLPFGVFRRKATGEGWRGGVAIGDMIVDLAALVEARLLSANAETAAKACLGDSLNQLLELGPDAWSGLRAELSGLLEQATPHQAALSSVLVRQDQAEMALPVEIGDYTDFFASIHHARRAGLIIRGQAEVLPNYKHLPVGYHGRASSVATSGTPVTRPLGQFPDPDGSPIFAPSRKLDFELEVAAIVGRANGLGEPIPVADAHRHVFGFCLSNDWSARDIQAFEAQPLGPFLAKSFLTTISPWIVTTEALAPFRAPLDERDAGDPAAPAHLRAAGEDDRLSFDIELGVSLSTKQMRSDDQKPVIITRSNLKHLYWSIDQMIAHHTSNGCNLRVGDMIATGTVSGPQDESAGCLLEITEGGKRLLHLPGSETRTYLEDHDDVMLTGKACRDGFRSIGFGPCFGRVRNNARQPA